jgi:predicted amidohydrolase
MGARSRTGGISGTLIGFPRPVPTLLQAMRAHLVQLDIAWEDAPANHDRVLALLDSAAGGISRGDFILLPEMFDSGFSFNTHKTNDTQGRTLQFLLDLADDLGVVVQAGRTVAPCHRCSARNITSVVGPGQRLLCEYAKMHLFSPGGEDRAFEPGKDVVAYELPEGVLVQPAICYDLRFPELFRVGRARGAEAIALGACWPSTRAHHWRALLIARAIENQALVLGVNRVGSDPPKENGFPAITYAGGSIAVSPTGEVLGELNDRPGVLSVPVDADAVRSWRSKFRCWGDARLVPEELKP